MRALGPSVSRSVCLSAAACVPSLFAERAARARICVDGWGRVAFLPAVPAVPVAASPRGASLARRRAPLASGFESGFRATPCSGFNPHTLRRLPSTPSVAATLLLREPVTLRASPTNPSSPTTREHLREGVSLPFWGLADPELPPKKGRHQGQHVLPGSSLFKDCPAAVSEQSQLE